MIQTKMFNTLTEQLEERLESSPGTPDSAPNSCVLRFSENTRLINTRVLYELNAELLVVAEHIEVYRVEVVDVGEKGLGG